MRRVFTAYPWLFALIAAGLIVAATVAASGQNPGRDLSAAAQDSSVLVMIGMGQLFVITAGVGNIDLSIPGIMALAAFVGSAVASWAGNPLVGIGAALVVGVLIAIVNLILIMLIGIPPIIATLATGLIVDSAVLVAAGRLTASAPPALMTLMDTRWRGLPAVAIVAALTAAGGALVLHRTRFGRELIATGQSSGAAGRSGVDVMRRTAYCYIVSGCCAGVAGLLLSSLNAAPAIGIGDPYLLLTVAVVVLGGSSIMGGRPTALGVVIASVMLNVMLTLFYTLHMSIAVQDMAEGLLIIAALAGGGERSRLRA